MTAPLLEVADLVCEFRDRGRTVRALNGVSLTIGTGETVGLVGESGCGKSTLARSIVRLLTPTSGRLLFDGQDYTHWGERRLRRLRKDVQIVFQDPTTALNPSWTVRQLILEPLALHRVGEPERRLSQVLDEVELPSSVLGRRPGQLSGGQRQRVAIARAIATRPRFVVLDEPTASVDMSIRASLLRLLRKLQREEGLTYLLISHDLSTVRHLCDRLLVMYLGRIVEEGRTGSIFDNPTHVYTRVLLSAIPIPDPAAKRQRLPILGEPPSPTAIPTGCPFRPRCQLATGECERPQPLYEVGAGHRAACRLARMEPLGETSTPA
ncbi:MAG TPA: ABC transporter ATP-binding protein [Candidatus Dormibacteraeota bacterium]|nr:ABC transporter ATP-binding protein [Candidatus Dormibacteraeota bacterium]